MHKSEKKKTHPYCCFVELLLFTQNLCTVVILTDKPHEVPLSVVVASSTIIHEIVNKVLLFSLHLSEDRFLHSFRVYAPQC